MRFWRSWLSSFAASARAGAVISSRFGMARHLAPELDGIAEGPRLLADDLKLPVVFGELESGEGNSRFLQGPDRHGLIQQRRITEAGGAEDETLGAALFHP